MRIGRDYHLADTLGGASEVLTADILARMRHDGCGGRAARAELMTGIESASSRPVRRIVLRAG